MYTNTQAANTNSITAASIVRQPQRPRFTLPLLCSPVASRLTYEGHRCRLSRTCQTLPKPTEIRTCVGISHGSTVRRPSVNSVELAEYRGLRFHVEMRLAGCPAAYPGHRLSSGSWGPRHRRHRRRGFRRLNLAQREPRVAQTSVDENEPYTASMDKGPL